MGSPPGGVVFSLCVDVPVLFELPSYFFGHFVAYTVNCSHVFVAPLQPVRRSGRLLLVFCVTCVEKDSRRDARKRSIQWPPGACAGITNAPTSATPYFAPHTPTYIGRPQLGLHGTPSCRHQQRLEKKNHYQGKRARDRRTKRYNNRLRHTDTLTNGSRHTTNLIWLPSA